MVSLALENFKGCKDYVIDVKICHVRMCNTDIDKNDKRCQLAVQHGRDESAIHWSLTAVLHWEVDVVSPTVQALTSTKIYVTS